MNLLPLAKKHLKLIVPLKEKGRFRLEKPSKAWATEMDVKRGLILIDIETSRCCTFAFLEDDSEAQIEKMLPVLLKTCVKQLKQDAKEMSVKSNITPSAIS